MVGKEKIDSEFAIKKAIENPIGRLIYTLILWLFAGGIVYWLSTLSELQFAKEVSTALGGKLNSEFASIIGALGVALTVVSVAIRPTPYATGNGKWVFCISGNLSYFVGKVAGDFMFVAFSGLSFVTGWFIAVLYFKNSLELTEVAISAFGFFMLAGMLLCTGFLMLVAQLAYREYRYFSWVDKAPYLLRIVLSTLFCSLMYIVTAYG